MKRLILPTIFSLFCVCCLSGCQFYYGLWHGNLRGEVPRSHGAQARDLAKEGKADEAIKEYELHVKRRLNDSRRPSDENPYFYYLLIGDLYLDTNRIEQARKAYLIAKENNVEKDLFIDRWRKLARAYTKAGDIERAINTLREYRNIDPVVFDYDIDQLHKQMIRAYDRSSAPKSRNRGFSRGGTRDY